MIASTRFAVGVSKVVGATISQARVFQSVTVSALAIGAAIINTEKIINVISENFLEWFIGCFLPYDFPTALELLLINRQTQHSAFLAALIYFGRGHRCLRGRCNCRECHAAGA